MPVALMLKRNTKSDTIPNAPMMRLYGMRRSSHHTMAVNGVTGVDGSANSPLVGGGLVMIQNGCGELPNGRDEQIAALDSQLSRTLSRFCSIAWFYVPLPDGWPLLSEKQSNALSAKSNVSARDGDCAECYDRQRMSTMME
jgi:hypothetical protein